MEKSPTIKTAKLLPPVRDDAEKAAFLHGPIMADEPEANLIKVPTLKLPRPKSIPPACYVALLGLQGVGKTKLTIRIALNTYSKDRDQVEEEQSFRKLWTIDNHTSRLEFLDSPSNAADHNSTNEKSIRTADAVLLIYSITDRPSFLAIQALETQVRAAKKEREKEHGAFNAFWLVGNKSDEEGGRMVSRAEGEKLARAMGMGFSECSAKTGEGVWDVVDGVVRVVRRETAERMRVERREEERQKREREKKAAREEARERRLRVWKKVASLGLLRQREQREVAK